MGEDTSKPGRVWWSELERDAHRMVLDMLQNGEAVENAELVACQVLFTRSDLTDSRRQDYVKALAETIRRYAELLQERIPLR
jgi:hypothetical protein